MKTMLMTWLTSGTFLGAVIGLVVYILGRDPARAMLFGVFGGFITGAAAAVLSGWVDQRLREDESASSAQDSES